MITFESGIDLRCRSVNVPTVARVRVDNPNCAFRQLQLRDGAKPEYRYCVIGTEYGYIHTTAGDLRTWKSYSGARRAARNYVPL